MPLKACKGGSRNEADVVDCKFLEDESLEIKHVEIGALAGSESDNVKKIRKSFD